MAFLPDMRVRGRLQRLVEVLRTGFWAIPTVSVLMAAALALGLVAVDRLRAGSATGAAFGSGPDGAREVLSAITTSMITFTGLVFSITVVVLQLTSSQFSPRVLRTFLRDRHTQLSLGVFVATFVYAVLVLRSVDSTAGSTFVPAVATTAGVVLLLVSVGMFISYIHHIAKAIQVSSLIRAVGDETRAVIERLDRSAPAGPALRSSWPASTSVITTSRFGVVTTIDEPGLVRLACEQDVLLVLRCRIGEFLPAGAALADVHGVSDPDASWVKAVRRAVVIAKDRTMEQDLAFGLRQLVDIAERALSPGVNDPTTAVQALDELHDLMRRLVTRPRPSGERADGDGRLRLVIPTIGVSGLLDLAFEEIALYGAEAPQVRRRLDEVLLDLEAAALPSYRLDVVAAREAHLRSPSEG